MIRRVALTIFLVISVGQWGYPGTAEARPISVIVSVLPQRYFVQQIGGDKVDVHVMVPPGASPATYEPKPAQMAALASSRLYLAIGVPFESAWLARFAAANPRMTIVHTDRGIQKRQMDAHAHEDGAHTSDTDGGGIPDPHIWLSPPLVAVQARTICDALAAEDPGHANDFAAGRDRFIAEINALDADLKAVFSGFHGRRFMVFHPSWGYFAEAYGLVQIPIEVEGKAPKPAQLTQIITLARQYHITAVFVQPQFSTKSAALVAGAIGGRIVPADPLAPDWPQNLKAVATTFSEALR